MHLFKDSFLPSPPKQQKNFFQEDTMMLPAYQELVRADGSKRSRIVEVVSDERSQSSDD